MRLRRALRVFALVALAAPHVARAQNAAPPPLNMSQAFSRAVAAARGGDLRGAIALLRTADAMAPGNPDVLYALARVSARAGDAQGTLAALDRLVPIGLASDLSRDTTFERIRDASRSGRRFASNAVLSEISELSIRSDLADPSKAPPW